jgi:alcohol dehydrogenase class IV
MLTLQLPTHVLFGSGATARLRLPSGPSLLVLSPSMPRAQLDPLLEDWHGCGHQLHLLYKPAGEPDSQSVDNAWLGLSAAMRAELRSVLALGGGSVIDFAKAIAVLAVNGGAIADYEFGARTIGSALPLFAIPTTCGSGSEVTPYAVVNNSITGRKFTLSHPALYPQEALIDPELLVNMPIAVLRDTALDAFTHCLEALLNRQSAELVAPWAEDGLHLAYRLIPRIGHAPLAADDFAHLARLALWGGASIASSRTGLIHTLSVAIARFSSHAHGLLNASLLRHALAHNLPGYQGRLAQVVHAMMTDTAAPADDAEALRRLTAWLTGIIGDVRPAEPELLHQHRTALVDRLLQDKGLPAVSHGDINPSTLDRLIGNIAHET